ncbi:MAG: arginine--tRNA ligase, partial [Erysipelotrichales bacterium]|nr:arginine--tRNA ligase [Erysipelotrichales bacterium]
YYAQYAHARICSILRQAPEFKALESYDLLVEEKETALLKYINEFVSVVSDAAATRSPNKICNYIQKLASLFHSFYGAHKIIDPENEALTNQRLGLLLATKITLANALDFIGITAPEKM